jgi:Tfp pilus assembly protein PilZ
MTMSTGVLSESPRALTSAERDEAEAANRRRDKRFAVDSGVARVRCKKFEVDGAFASVVPSGILSMLFRRRSSGDVLNLSKGGMAIETTSKIARGRHVTVHLQVPDSSEVLTLTGTVRWQKKLAHSKYCTIGIQFDAFSTREGCNSPSALEALRAIEARYS